MFSRDLACTSTRSSAIGMNHTCLCLASYSWYSFTDPGGIRKAELAWVAGYVVRQTVCQPERQSPIPLLTGLNVLQLRWSRPTRYRYTKPPITLTYCDPDNICELSFNSHFAHCWCAFDISNKYHLLTYLLTKVKWFLPWPTRHLSPNFAKMGWIVVA